MTRQWKWIPNYEGLYQVSNDGLIKSVDRILTSKDGRVYNYKSVILKQRPTKSGYYQVTLRKNATNETFYVHKAVAMAFLGASRYSGMCITINHKDGKKKNNSADNLELVSMFENRHHAMRNNLWSQFGEQNHEAKLTCNDAKKIRQQYKYYKITYSYLAKQYNVSIATIRNIVKGFTYKQI